MFILSLAFSIFQYLFLITVLKNRQRHTDKKHIKAADKVFCLVVSISFSNLLQKGLNARTAKRAEVVRQTDRPKD